LEPLQLPLAESAAEITQTFPMPKQEMVLRSGAREALLQAVERQQELQTRLGRQGIFFPLNLQTTIYFCIQVVGRNLFIPLFAQWLELAAAAAAEAEIMALHTLVAREPEALDLMALLPLGGLLVLQHLVLEKTPHQNLVAAAVVVAV